MAFSNSLLGIVHALAHPIGGFYNANHGSINAVLLPEVIRYDLPVVTEKLPELAWGLGHAGEANGLRRWCRRRSTPCLRPAVRRAA